jgi:putative lipase involved disintegration of autophagic bodies
VHRFKKLKKRPRPKKEVWSHNAIQFFIIYMPSQQPQHSVDKSNYVMDNHNIKSKSNYRQALEENTLMQRRKQKIKKVIIIIIFRVSQEFGAILQEPTEGSL